MSSIARWNPGDHLRVFKDEKWSLWTLKKRKIAGWQAASVQGDDPRTFSDDEIRDLRLDEALEYYPTDPDCAIDERRLKVFDAYPETSRLIALRMETYLREVERLKEAGLSLEDCFARVPDAIFAEHGPRWQQQEDTLRARIEGESAKRARLPDGMKKPKKAREPLTAPRPSTLETNYRLWRAQGKDIRVLIPAYDRRGNRSQKLKIDDWNPYDLMKQFLKKYYLTPKDDNLRYAHRKLRDHYKSEGRKAPSYRTLLMFKNREYDAREEDTLRSNKRAAYLKYNVFQRGPIPEKPLEEVEVDHCLIDLIVVDEHSGRPLGRPWFSAVIDRRTRCILGAHLSFEVPGWAALQRCLAHAFWPKDLRGMGLKHEWPCEGIPDRIFVDNGKEFRSNSLKISEASMNFLVVNLKVRSPWLKGKIERLFGRMNVQVFSHEDGKTFSNTKQRGDYNSVKEARITLPELKRKILEWIVDEYHVTPHEGEGMEGSPLEEWMRLTRLHRVPTVRSFNDIVDLTGQVIERKIQNDGVHWYGLTYYSKELTALRSRRGALDAEFVIRMDPYNAKEIRILDRVTGKRVVATCQDPRISHGVSIHQAKVHVRIAKQSGASGAVTTDDLARARQKASTESEAILADGKAKTTAARAARYSLDNGAYLTPIGRREVHDPSTPELALQQPTSDQARGPVQRPAQIVPVAPQCDVLLVHTSAQPRGGIVDLTAEIEAQAKIWSEVA